jgi:hypothetical protein
LGLQSNSDAFSPQLLPALADNLDVVKACYRCVINYNLEPATPYGGLLPFQDDTRADRIAPALRPVNGQASLRERFFRNGAAQVQIPIRSRRDNAF